MKDNFSPEVKSLHIPAILWSQIIETVDRKVEMMHRDSGWGSISVEIVVKNGLVKDIVFADIMRLRQEGESKKESPLDK